MVKKDRFGLGGLEVDIGQSSPAGFCLAYAPTKDRARINALEEYAEPPYGIMIVQYEGEWYMSDGVNSNTGDPFTDTEIQLLRNELDFVEVL